MSAIAQRRDPTQSIVLRRNYVRAFDTRLRRLRGLVRTTVEENDALRLRPSNRLARLAEPGEDFGFMSVDDPSKERAFMEWFRQAIREEFLEELPDGRVRRGEHYSGSFLRAAYRKGIRFARSALTKAGIEFPSLDIQTEFNFPIHQNELRFIYRRNYALLEDITEDTADAVAETLTEGFAEGVNPRVMATRLNGRIDAITQTRAETLARTEVIRTHSSATLNRYERVSGLLSGVSVQAEFLSTDDERRCPVCKAIDDRDEIYTIDGMRNATFEYEPDEDEDDTLAGEYPVKPPCHPRCRCCVVPVV